MKRDNKHVRTWQTQPIVNNTGAGNSLYTGNKFKVIWEKLTYSIFQELHFIVYQKFAISSIK